MVMYHTQLILEARNVAGFWDFDEVLGVSITPSLLNATIVLLHFHNFIYSFNKLLQVHSLPKSYIVCFLLHSFPKTKNTYKFEFILRVDVQIMNYGKI